MSKRFIAGHAVELHRCGKCNGLHVMVELKDGVTVINANMPAANWASMFAKDKEFVSALVKLIAVN